MGIAGGTGQSVFYPELRHEHGQTFHFSESEVPHLQNKHNLRIYLLGLLWGLNVMLRIKHSAKGLTAGKCSVHGSVTAT